MMTFDRIIMISLTFTNLNDERDPIKAEIENAFVRGHFSFIIHFEIVVA